MAEFLLEILSEEIPARMQAKAAEDLHRLVTTALTEAGLTFDRAEAHVTPRRLALVVDGLPERTPDRVEERKGPRVGAPEAAVAGFLKGAGLTSLDQAEQRDTGKGVFWFASTRVPGRETASLLAEIVPAAMLALPWPKSMRWGSHRLRWVRPLSSLMSLSPASIISLSPRERGERLGEGGASVGAGPDTPSPNLSPSRGRGTGEAGEALGLLALIDGKPIAPTLDLAGETLTVTDRTVGHRFLTPEPFPITSFADYQTKLRAAHIILDRRERRQAIFDQGTALAATHGLVVEPDEGLLDEVTGLVEWPVVLMGAIDAQFMDLPVEVRRSTMRANQKYFTLLNPDGTAAPHFLLVANIAARDGGAAIVAGNERVLRARLADARFFWDEDRKLPLASRRQALDGIVFHAKLGSLGERVERIAHLATALAEHIPGCDRLMALEAARLAKCDLTTGMVGEFPELQGTMGRYYALAEGAPAEVADAIRDHYKPLGPADSCPTAPVSVAVALAEKLDTLVGFFAIGETPTGSKDPFALRRAALGVIRLVLENGLRLELRQVFAEALRLYTIEARPETADQLLAFFADRLKVVLRDRGVRHDRVDAIFALAADDDLHRLAWRVRVLDGFLGTGEAANLLAGAKRAANILRIEEKNDGVDYPPEPDPALFTHDAESALALQLDDANREAHQLFADEAFVDAMALMARLRAPIDAFFEAVTVNDPDQALRANRLKLLAAIRETLNGFADFSRIEG